MRNLNVCPRFEILMTVYVIKFCVSFLASAICLTTQMIVELVGLEKLTNGIGLLYLCRGISNAMGPPLEGKCRWALFYKSSNKTNKWILGPLFLGKLSHPACGPYMTLSPWCLCEDKIVENSFCPFFRWLCTQALKHMRIKSSTF